MQPRDMELLERAIEEITDRAVAAGLDFFPMRYEITPPDISTPSAPTECPPGFPTGASAKPITG